MLLWMLRGVAAAALGVAVIAWLRRGSASRSAAKTESEAARGALGEFHAGGVRLARDKASGQLLALAPVPSDDAPATGVYAWRRGAWRDAGRVVEGLTPDQTLRRHRGQLLAA